MNQKKKHHFVAQTYLKEFCNSDGKVCVYSKDDPSRPRWASPASIGYEKYYYSQPTPDGGVDNNKLEDYFSSIENEWPHLVNKIKRGEKYNGGLNQLLLFVLMHRVRVPTARDAVEKTLAASVKMSIRHLNDQGQLPAPPDGFTFEYLDKHMAISIDPHKSIHAMVDLAKGVEKIFGAIGFRILENETDLNFITSDNPVVYFDPTVPLSAMQPYNIDRDRMTIEFMFPMTPRLMLWGHSDFKPTDGLHTVSYEKVIHRDFVKRANVLIAKFAHRMVFASEQTHTPLVKKYAPTSPVASVQQLRTLTGRGIFTQMVFGKREQKPKWLGTTEP
ncbi:MAG: DUF4238 domain-containing protein [Afipia sp.]|nr:DUF4238 domain-containing protein [Afipia sp.]